MEVDYALNSQYHIIENLVLVSTVRYRVHSWHVRKIFKQPRYGSLENIQTDNEIFEKNNGLIYVHV